ncbi:hypothetical protein RRG08_054175 [Elysia crispata]|uniref:Uncharacterized protein n=1 Tax=Elysia crispata TaxID=231223 RepID=A0AAE1A451_9GAST|nr:hypothetical protein RRG08_054175 [Elysia crispata]
MDIRIEKADPVKPRNEQTRKSESDRWLLTPARVKSLCHVKPHLMIGGSISGQYLRTLHITLTEQPDRENNSTTQGKKTTTTESRNNVEYFKDQTPSGSLHRGMDGAHRSARPGLYVFTSAEITEKAVKKHTACGDKMLHRGHFTLARKDT